MATKKTASTEDNALDAPGSDFDFDNAVNELRGVMKHDVDGTAPSADDDSFGFDFPGGADASPAMPSFGDSAGASDDFAFQSAGTSENTGAGMHTNLDLIMDIPIDVHVVLGTSRISVSNLMNLQEGAVVALDKKIGEPVDITVNGRRIARGEITVLEDDDTRFGVKLIEVMSSRTN